MLNTRLSRVFKTNQKTIIPNMSGFSRFTSKLIASPAGRLIARPWLDSSALYLLKNWYFPLSRLWAAARAAEGDVDRFIKQVPLERPSKSQRKTIASALRQFERARLKAFSIEQLWHYYFFGEEPVAEERLPIIEEMRLDFRTDYNMARKKFSSLRRLVKTSVSMNPPTPEDVASRFGEMAKNCRNILHCLSNFRMWKYHDRSQPIREQTTGYVSPRPASK